MVYIFNQSNISHPSLEVVYLFLPWKELQQSSILWSILCRFYSLYHFLSLAVTHCHLLSPVVICCYSLSLVVPLVVIPCTIRCLSLSLVVIRCHSLYHSLSLVVTRCTSRLSFYKWSHAECHFNKVALKRWRKFTGEQTCWAECHFNKVGKQLYWNHTSAWLFSCKFAGYFQNTFS